MWCALQRRVYGRKYGSVEALKRKGARPAKLGITQKQVMAQRYMLASDRPDLNIVACRRVRFRSDTSGVISRKGNYDLFASADSTSRLPERFFSRPAAQSHQLQEEDRS